VQFVDLKASHERYKSAIDARFQQVFEHGKYVNGPEVAELETELARYVEVAHSVTTASGTSALEIALRALGVGPRDDVITTPFTFVASAEAILKVGARPVFVDIEPKTFNIDVSQIERAVTPRTKAILPVSLFGQMPDFGAINAIAERHGLGVIEDGAQSFGASQRGRRSGGIALIGATSFVPSKPLGCYGDGGALFTDDADLAARMRAMRMHGAERPAEYSLLGTNARLDTLQAAVLLVKLPGLEWELEQRRRFAARYSEALAGVCGVPEVLEGNLHVCAQYVVRVPRRDEVAAQLKEQGIPTAVHYPKCLHEQPIFRDLAEPGQLPEAERAAREVLSLPVHPFLSDEEQGRVIDAFRACR
jgi:UDP-2-acetamido-2-deoxy-ribo-hexuluronate aminotransferase